MFEEINTAPLICVRIKRRWASSFIPNKRPHQLVMLVDLMDACLIPRDLIARSSQWASLETVEHSPGEVAITSMTVSQSYVLSDSHKVPAETLMTRVNGAWPFSWQVRRSFCPACCPVCLPLSLLFSMYGQARGLICTLAEVLFQHWHGHSRMIKYSAWMGAVSREPAGCSLEDFNFVFFSQLLPLSQIVCAFLHSPVWLQLGMGKAVQWYVKFCVPLVQISVTMISYSCDPQKAWS